MARLTSAEVAVALAVASICVSAAHAEALVADSGHEDVTIVLSGYTAELSGPDVRNDRGQITHWHSTDCSATWTVSVAEPSEVEVEVVAAVQPPYEGSRFELSIGEATLSGEMAGTGGWTDYRRFSLGKVRVNAGTLPVHVRPTALPKGVFGNIRSIRITGAHLSRQPAGHALDNSGPIDVITTSKHGGNRLARQDSLHLVDRIQDDAILVAVDPSQRFQEIEGFGGAFTEAAAMVWSELSPARQDELIHAYFDLESGHGYRLCRTHINSCDFSVGNYAYTEVDGDIDLKHFSIDHDREYLLPLIHAAKEAAGDQPIKLLASPWSPPAWMKTNGQMTGGGKLKPEYRDAWARYYCRYIDEYEKEGIPIWGLTVQNEPDATQRWESCRYTAEEERDFVRDYLGPTLHRNGRQDVNLIVWDHNRDLLFDRASCVFDDPEASKYVWGAGFHWYVSDEYHHVKMVNDFYPDKKLLFTEGCLEGADNIGEWSSGEHYGKSVINDLNHGAVGWIDWNLLLNTEGGPNHVGNYCAAPIIADVENDKLLYSSSYYYLGHFARFVRPGARRLLCANTGVEVLSTAFANPDGSIVVVLLNERDYPIRYGLKIGDLKSEALIAEHAITTLVIKPDAL